jgi:hypothetical protein
MGPRVILLLLAVTLIRCGDQERGGYCFSGTCLQADGGSYSFPEFCDPQWCYLPDEAPAAGIAACQRYIGSYYGSSPCAAAPTGCRARYAPRRDWDDCYRRYGP